MIYVRSKFEVELYIQRMIKENRLFEVHTRNGEKVVVSDTKERLGRIFRNKISKEEYGRLWVYSTVRKQISTRLKRRKQIYFADTQLSPQVRNKPVFDSIDVGTSFKGVDANHAYWRMAFLRGYITEDLYRKLLPPEFKLLRNKSLACLVSTKKIEQFKGKELLSSYELGDPLLTEVYLDIRQSLYQIFHGIIKILEGQGFLKYHTDCIYVLPEKENICKGLIMARDMHCSVSECFKVNEEEFLEIKPDGREELKKF